jgi:hypothetical protein
MGIGQNEITTNLHQKTFFKGTDVTSQISLIE